MTDNLHSLNLQHLTPVYLALLISGGQVGLPIVLLTATFCKKATWHPTILNFCITWIVYSIVYCLYLYDGTGTDNQYSKMCIVQASMIHGAAPMAIVSGLAIVLHTWTTLHGMDCNLFSRIPRMLYLILILGTPYLVFIIFSVSAAALIMVQSRSVCSNGLYCVVQVSHKAAVVPAFCAAVMVISLGLEAAISLQYYRQWKFIKTSFPLATRTPSPCSLWFRVGLFCLYSCVTLTSALLFLSHPHTEVTYILPSALPLCALVVVGLQKGVISLWTTALRGRKQSASTFELEMPSARAASRSDPALVPIGFAGEATRDSSMPV